MGVIGRIAGRGLVSSKGEILGEVEYDIVVSQRPGGGSKSADGTMTGDPVVLFQAAEAGHLLMLALETGGTVEFTPTRTTVSGEIASARIAVSGPVPGF